MRPVPDTVPYVIYCGVLATALLSMRGAGLTKLSI